MQDNNQILDEEGMADIYGQTDLPTIDDDEGETISNQQMATDEEGMANVYGDNLEEEEETDLYAPDVMGDNRHIPESHNKPIVETEEGQKNSTHFKDAVEAEKSDRSIIGKIYDDVSGFVTDPVEALSVIPRAVSGGLGELSQFIGDVDKQRQLLTGTLRFDLGEDQKFNISDLIQIPEYIPPSELKKQIENSQYNSVYYAMSDQLEQARGIFPKPETVTGEIAEELLKFFVGMKGVDKVTKLGSGLKGLYVNSAITSAAFFDPEEEWLANTLNEVKPIAPYIPDIMVSSKDKSDLENRLAKAIEAGALIAPFQIPAITKVVSNALII